MKVLFNLRIVKYRSSSCERIDLLQISFTIILKQSANQEFFQSNKTKVATSDCDSTSLENMVNTARGTSFPQLNLVWFYCNLQKRAIPHSWLQVFENLWRFDIRRANKRQKLLFFCMYKFEEVPTEHVQIATTYCSQVWRNLICIYLLFKRSEIATYACCIVSKFINAFVFSFVFLFKSSQLRFQDVDFSFVHHNVLQQRNIQTVTSTKTQLSLFLTATWFETVRRVFCLISKQTGVLGQTSWFVCMWEWLVKSHFIDFSVTFRKMASMQILSCIINALLQQARILLNFNYDRNQFKKR